MKADTWVRRLASRIRVSAMEMNLRWASRQPWLLFWWHPSRTPVRSRPTAARYRTLHQQGERALAERRYADAEQAYERLRQLQPECRRSACEARADLLPAGQVRRRRPIPPPRAHAQTGACRTSARCWPCRCRRSAVTRRRCRGSRRRSTSSRPTPLCARMAGLHLQRDLHRPRTPRRAPSLSRSS